MANRSEHYSLSEVLGDDQWLWNMWKRRKSTISPTEEEMHNMFAYDPDMRVLGMDNCGGLEEERADPITFDSFNFSRKSSNNDVAESPSSVTSGHWDSFLDSPVLNQSSRTTTNSSPPTSPIRPIKEHKRRPSLFRLGSRTASYADDGIQLQQRNSTRDVHIKKRKSLQNY